MDPAVSNIGKAERSDGAEARASAANAAGGAALGGGLLASGVPGSQKLSGYKRYAGGVFGYRDSAHAGALKEFRNDWKNNEGLKANKNQLFMRHRVKGKIEPERKIIGHMRVGRKIGYGLTGAGAAGLAYGASQNRKAEEGKKDGEDRETSRGAIRAVAGGGTTAAGALVAEKVLGGQGNKWLKVAEREREEAARLAPRTAGRTADEAYSDKKTFRRVPEENVKRAGELRGSASQHNYFGRTYNKNARYAGKVKGLAAAVGLAGAGKLAYDEMKGR